MKGFFINTHSIENRLLQDRKIYCLLARPGIFQPGNVTGWGSEGVNCLAGIKAVLLVRILCNVRSFIIITIITVFIVTDEVKAKIFPFEKESLGTDAKVDGWIDDAWMNGFHAGLQ